MTNCYIWDTRRACREIVMDRIPFILIHRVRAADTRSPAQRQRCLAIWTLSKRVLPTTWLCNQRDAGIEFPSITADIINSVKSFQPLTTTERIERAVFYFNKKLRVGEVIEFSASDTRGEADEFRLMAITESSNTDELIAFLN